MDDDAPAVVLELRRALKMPPLTPPACEDRHDYRAVAGAPPGAPTHICAKCGAAIVCETDQ